MKKRELIIRWYPFILLFTIFIIVFRQFFFSRLLPFPGDLLVSFFFPYNSGGWEGFVQYVAHKEFIASDAVRQIYPWRTLAMDLFKQGQLPLWNPYSFSGTPLLANLQSAVFYPLNILLLIFGEKVGWTLFILCQPLLAGLFMYLYLRSLKLEKLAAVFSGVAYGYIGYTMIWFELGVVGHTALWLPLSLWGVTKYATKKNYRYLLISALSLSSSLLAGHAQTAIYSFLITVAYSLVITHKARFIAKLHMSFLLFLSLGIAASQLLPSFELMQLSARDAETSAQVFYRMQLPWYQLAMLLAPDFFGNPAANNFWGKDYNEFLSYVGVVAFLFSLIGITHFVKHLVVRFFIVVGILGVLFALPTPLSAMLQILRIPILGTGIPARSLFLLEVSLVVLAGFGVQALLTKKNISWFPFIIMGICYLVLWVIVLAGPQISTVPASVSHFAIAKRNLLLPTLLFLCATLFLLSTRYKPQLKVFAVLLCIFLAATEYSYLFSKYLPFSPAQFMFPTHPLITYLQQKSPPERFYGYATARIDTNFSTQWRIFSPEGYDPLYSRSYGELFYAFEKGKYETKVPRSDALFASSLAKDDSFLKQRLLNLVGVKYVLDKKDGQQIPWDPDPANYPPGRFRLIHQQGKYKVYENTKALPRAGVYYAWETTLNRQQAIEKLLQQPFTYQNTLVISGSSPKKISSLQASPARIIRYTPNTVIIQAIASTSGILMLTDAYYPGWNAYVDQRKQPILIADAAFRGVQLEPGKHEIIFRYEPISFYLGAGISAISLVALVALFLRPQKQTGDKDE